MGGAFGFMLGGPLGALLGAALGHGFDAGLRRAGHRALPGGGSADARERTQTAFFTATFAVMGHLAKVDGRVSPDEIRMATAVMDRMQLDPGQRRLAQELFRAGKAADFSLDPVLEQLRRECRFSRSLVRVFVEILVHAAYADGHMDPSERRLLLHVCQRMGFSSHELAHIERLVQAELGGARAAAPADEPTLAEAYRLLDVSEQASDAEVKRAYRRLMSQHHPDKLVARGLPEEMVQVATRKTQEVRRAYDRVRRARGGR